MIPFPVAERELLVAARGGRVHWQRSLFAFAALAILGWILASVSRWNTPTQSGTTAFYGLSTVAMVFALLAGVILTADSLAEERREGTLGLLFLTDLRGWDIILGKLAANGIGALLSLLALVPMLMLPMLMGGVAAFEALRMALLIGSSAFFSLAFGLLVSTIFRTSRMARTLALAGRSLLCAALQIEPPCPEDLIGSLASVPIPAQPTPGIPSSPLFADPLQDRLLQEHGIEVPIIPWPAPDGPGQPQPRLLRISAQLYNALPQYQRLADALRVLLPRP